jgi:salicylate hydroxylase
VPAALSRYEELRRARATEVQLRSRANRDVFHLPDGAEQRERDAAIAAADSDVYRWLWEPQTSIPVTSTP